MIFSAALAAVAMAMPTNDNGKGCSANGTEHEASPISPPTYGTTTSVKVKPTLTSSPPKYSTTTSVKVKPTLPTSYKNEASSTRTSKGPLPTKTPGNGGNDCAKGCITEKQAEQGAEIFRQLIQNYTDTLALTVLTPDFEDYSSSVNIIRNRGNKGPIQVNGISFISREDFMNAQGAQPQIPFDTLNVFHGCDSITVRWQTTDSAAGKATKANDIVSRVLLALVFLLLTVLPACTWYRNLKHCPSYG